jgi:hypothetical protein
MDEDFGLTPQIADTPLDLTKDEKLRSMALMLAIRHHGDTVIKDAGIYQQYKMEGRNMQPLNDELVIATAVRYEAFIRCGENAERMAFIEQVADKLDEMIENGDLDEEKP